jgi:hypothetical protein
VPGFICFLFEDKLKQKKKEKEYEQKKRRTILPLTWVIDVLRCC